MWRVRGKELLSSPMVVIALGRLGSKQLLEGRTYKLQECQSKTPRSFELPVLF
jgi:hypothetical protein